MFQGLFPRDILFVFSAWHLQPLTANEAEHGIAAEEKRCQTQFPLLWFLVENKNPCSESLRKPLGFTLGIVAYSFFLTMRYRWEKAGLTYSKAHAKGNISYCVHAAIDRHMTQIYEVAHNWHHGGIHHSWSWGRETYFRKIPLMVWGFFPFNVLANYVLKQDAKSN